MVRSGNANNVEQSDEKLVQMGSKTTVHRRWLLPSFIAGFIISIFVCYVIGVIDNNIVNKYFDAIISRDASGNTDILLRFLQDNINILFQFIQSVFSLPILPPFCGAGFAFLLAWIKSRSEKRRDTSIEFINEYFSTDFLVHRISVGELRRKVKLGTTAVDDVAGGFWYPGSKNYYKGDVTDGLNEHQHLEAYFGFLVRIWHSDKNGLLDVDLLQSALSTSYDWEKKFVSKVAATTRTRIENHAGDKVVPAWVYAVERANKILGGVASNRANISVESDDKNL